MTTQNEKAKNVTKETMDARKYIDGKVNETREKALKRFEVKLFLDWCKEVGQNTFYVEVIGNLTGGRVTFLYSVFKTNEKQVLKKLNLIGSADGNIYGALAQHLDELYDKYANGDLPLPKVEVSRSRVKSLEWDDQVSLGHARSVAREFILNESQFALQSNKDFDSKRHLGVILDEEKGLPEGRIAVGFTGIALQAVLNSRGRIQTQKYRREILGGLAHIGVLDAEVGEYDDTVEEFEVIEEEENDMEEANLVEVDDDADVKASLYGQPITVKVRELKENGLKVDDKQDGKKRKKKTTKMQKKSNDLRKQRLGVKFYVMYFTKELLEEMKQYVAA
ncbi:MULTISPECIES: hypothetical protein [Paenibacillus]|uniref:hypothetical protein n=1 Tax=Paenibacillus TaxID=44249 RepID=UPI00096D7E69|nr:hypothetical protein [Paenibacillus odorifer]OME34977.1 hypothetical protein BSK58_25045 [Paenibacillus odorifer]